MEADSHDQVTTAARDDAATRGSLDVHRKELDVHRKERAHRQLGAEAVGTFLLVLTAVGTAAAGGLVRGHEVPTPSAVLATGAVVAGVVYAIGDLSGAHLNPAVTWAFALRGHFPWHRVPGYLTAQLVGALSASWVVALVVTHTQLGVTEPGPQVSPLRAFATEVLLTFGLVLVILGTASGHRNVGPNAALAIGGYIGLVSIWGVPLSGGSMNPARSLAPALVTGRTADWWIYVVGPWVGASLAVGAERILRGAPTREGDRSAQGEDSTGAPTDGTRTDGTRTDGTRT